MERPELVMSLEVAEHVPRSGEAQFLYNLLSLQPRKVILSWAHIGQGGHFHVNCQARALGGSRAPCKGLPSAAAMCQHRHAAFQSICATL
eukprot:4774127-Prymnesium_polylepis.2